MTAIADTSVTSSHLLPPRTSNRLICQICGDSMIAAEASAYISEDIVSYLWSCENCGYGFVTKHSLKKISCN